MYETSSFTSSKLSAADQLVLMVIELPLLKCILAGFVVDVPYRGILHRALEDHLHLPRRCLGQGLKASWRLHGAIEEVSDELRGIVFLRDETSPFGRSC